MTCEPILGGKSECSCKSGFMTDDGVDGACGSECDEGSWGPGCAVQCADSREGLATCDLRAAGMLVMNPPSASPPRALAQRPR